MHLSPSAIRCLAPVLAGIVVVAAPLSALPEEKKAVRGEALATADTIKREALLRLSNEATHIRAEDQQRLAGTLQNAVTEQLQTLRKRYAHADNLLDAQIGYLTPWASWWKSWWSEEDAQRVFQEKIDQAVVEAGIAVQKERMNKTLEAALMDYGTQEYQAYRMAFNRILAEVIGEEALLGPLAKPLIAELVERVNLTSRELAVKEGVVDLQDALSAPMATGVAVSAILAARIANSLLQRAGTANIGKGVAGKMLGGKVLGALFTGPVGTVVVLSSVVYDILHARSNAVEATQKILWGSYEATVQAYKDAAFLRSLTEGLVAGLEQQLQTDREATRIELDRFFDGILVQVNSPGFETFLGSRDQEENLKAIKRVSAVFGREAVETPFYLKYALTSDIAADRASAMVQQHGNAFVMLYDRQPKALAQVIQSPRYQEMMQQVLYAVSPDQELLFYKRSLDRFSGLDALQTDALLLIHALMPTTKPESINKDVLSMLGKVADRLEAVQQQAPEVAKTVTEWALQGQIGGTLMERLSAHANAALLFELPLHLGIDNFTRLLHAAGEDTLVRFVSDFSVRGSLSTSRALDLLRADGTGYLAVYQRPEGGGAQAVRTRAALVQAYGGTLSPETDHTLHWLLAHTGLDPQAINRTTVENLRAVGIPGAPWPAFLAIPAATWIARVGLMIPCTIVFVMLVLPAGMIWFRVFRFSLPGRRRTALPRPADIEAIPVGPDRVKELKTPGRHFSETQHYP